MTERAIGGCHVDEAFIPSSAANEKTKKQMAHSPESSRPT
jgi:hypothetical protein